MPQIKFLATSIFLFLFQIELASGKDTVKTTVNETPLGMYATKMLQLALDQAGMDCDVEPHHEYLSGQRSLRYTAEGKLDVMWTTTTTELEQTLIPIRIPLYKGMLSLRVLLIRGNEKGRLQGTKSLEDLRRLTLCQGLFWSDTAILRANELRVETSTKYDTLFHMLDGGRCDAFPRGIHEPWVEIQNHPELDLAVNDSVLISYPNPLYLFVTPRKPELADKIEKGLRQAIENGMFDSTFFGDEAVKSVITYGNLANRHKINLLNPNLPPETPLKDKTLWYLPIN